MDGQGSGERSVRARALFERRNVRDNHDDDSLDDGDVDDDDQFDDDVHDLDDSRTEGMPAHLPTRGQGVRGCMRGPATDTPPLQESLPEPREELRRIDGVSAPARIVLGAAVVSTSVPIEVTLRKLAGPTTVGKSRV